MAIMRSCTNYGYIVSTNVDKSNIFYCRVNLSIVFFAKKDLKKCLIFSNPSCSACCPPPPLLRDVWYTYKQF